MSRGAPASLGNTATQSDDGLSGWVVVRTIKNGHRSVEDPLAWCALEHQPAGGFLGCVSYFDRLALRLSPLGLEGCICP